MKHIENYSIPIGYGYSTSTGRLKIIAAAKKGVPIKVALIGDSTIDNGFWVQKNTPYSKKTHTVTHQTAVALSAGTNSKAYAIGNFAVDGATTKDLMRFCSLRKVLPVDADHTEFLVHQLNAVSEWQPDIAVLSIGGNNYRETLMRTLLQELNYFQVLLRITPDHTKAKIRDEFQKVKALLLIDYKNILDTLVLENPNLNRIVLLSQYYPCITDYTPYYIYTGFSHLARSKMQGVDPFTLLEETMNELYHEVLQYASNKDKEIVFADVTSSLNPLAGNHTHQIEPNERGSQIMGRMIACAIEYNFPTEEFQQDQNVAMLRLDKDEKQITSKIMQHNDLSNFKVKKISQFISENRYRHVGMFFSPSTSLSSKYESAYYMVMGKPFDVEYKGLPAFGLLDISLVSVMAAYLWKVVIDDRNNILLRVAAGIVAAPILLTKMIVGLALMLVVALPIYSYHKVAQSFHSDDKVNLELNTHNSEVTNVHEEIIEDINDAIRVRC